MSDVRIETRRLGGSPLSRLAQAGAHRSSGTRPGRARSRSGAQRAEEVRGRLRAGWRGWPGSRTRLVPRQARPPIAWRAWLTGRGIVVTTGQQPGLFGGPVYTWSKAVSALALADAIEAETGVPTAPVFWAATDDSDFAEGAYTWMSRTGGADRRQRSSRRNLRARVSLTSRCPTWPAPWNGSPRPVDPPPTAARSRQRARRTAAGNGRQRVRRTLLRALLEPLGIAVLDAVASRRHDRRRTRCWCARCTSASGSRARSSARVEALAGGRSRAAGADVENLTLVFERQGLRRERIPRARAAVAAATCRAGHRCRLTCSSGPWWSAPPADRRLRRRPG